jgi:ABC-2 type transport system ATP-binding protein
VYRLRVDTQNGEADGYIDALKALGGVLSVDPVEGRPEYRIAIDPTKTDANGLLRNLLDRGIPIAGFNKDQRHLNEAFMDLTERGVRT